MSCGNSSGCTNAFTFVVSDEVRENSGSGVMEWLQDASQFQNVNDVADQEF